MHIPILKALKKDGLADKNGHVLLIKMYLNFEDEGHSYAKCLFFVLTLYHKCVLFQFLGYSICTHIPILTGVQKGRIRG